MTSPTSLVDILDLERLDDNRFRGVSPDTTWQRTFGGQVVAQALVAAMRTVEGRPVHSLHAYFLLPGDPAAPIDYEVDRIRTGGSFSTRRVVARQHDRAIFSMSASFHRPEEGLDYQVPMPEAPPPETIPDPATLPPSELSSLSRALLNAWRNRRPVEFRTVRATETEKTRMIWFRCCGDLPDDDGFHHAALAYTSDMTLLGTTMIVHGRSLFDDDIVGASLDHAVWFHRPVRTDGWFLYVQESPWTGGARGFARGQIFTRDGVLVASVAQEGLIRRRKPTADRPNLPKT